MPEPGDLRRRILAETAKLRNRAAENSLTIDGFLRALCAIEEAADEIPPAAARGLTVCDGDKVVSIYGRLPVSGDVR